MNTKTKFKTKHQFRTELLKVVEQLSSDYADTFTVMTEDLVPIEAEGYHFIGQLLKPPYKFRTEAQLCQMIYRNIHKAELLSAGAGEIAFLSVMYILRKHLEEDISLSNESEWMSQWERAMEKTKFLIEQTSEDVKEDDLKTAVQTLCWQEPELAEACWEALSLAGLEGRVFIENGKQDNFVVELKEGYSFNLKPYKFFLERGKWEARQCKVLVVDGFVESVSEIDQVLNEAYDKKQPMAIISHGFSEEVVSTLYTNFQRGNLNVIPLRLMPDINSLNVINDIGVVCGMDPVSALKGQLLTFVKFDECPSVQRIIVSDKTTSIENFKTRSAVFSQIKQLLAKREENRLVEDIQNIIDGRIRSLSPNAVLLHLPNVSTIKNDAYRVKLDVSLRQCKTLLNYGIVRDHAISRAFSRDEITGRTHGKSSMLENEFEERFFELAEDILFFSKNRLGSAISSLSFYAGLMIGSKLAYMLLSTNGAVQRDED